MWEEEALQGMGQGDCTGVDDLGCRNKTLALDLKGGAIALIMGYSALGVALPLIGRRTQWLKPDGNLFFVAKSFAAGVILATGFVHMLPSAMESLTSQCLPRFPWHKFPFPGFIAMLASLVTLVIDFVATEFYETQHNHGDPDASAKEMLYKTFTACGRGIYSAKRSPSRIFGKARSKSASEQDLVQSIEQSKEPLPEGDRKVHIIGMREHAESHRHSHAEGTCKDQTDDKVLKHVGYSHNEIGASTNEVLEHVRHVVVAQVLELGIVAHSVIIGVTLGVSESPCTIRPLLAALSFHQFFEGFALGGCIAQAGFSYSSAVIMACCFAITTPAGIGIGIGISSSYNEKSSRSLIVEGVFDSISAGILVYMSLVDLIAADFLSKRMRCNRKLQFYSYASLITGCFAMSALAIWT
ncbi:zinc transporter 4, chloroplastic isoform X4 [Physcomitrium patens]|uniref:zinc transporter 4, chloroplastic isoform X4 n=1 Tax=Physcomitrium patens TaxID=3218 RepID=UPI003CCCEFBB